MTDKHPTKFTTDWLASKPVFYNEKTLKISYNINDVIDYSNIEFHPEGFNNYLDFGYSVFGQTPLKNVKFLKHSSEIFKDGGALKIINYPDPVENWFKNHPENSNEQEVFELIKNKIKNWENNNQGLIVIPTSGGMDSRLLNYFIQDKSRIRSYTYGISDNQSQSFEVLYAKKLCENLKIKWQQIELGDFHQYFTEWNNLFGVSTHSHGMYHIEFYKKILEKQDPSLLLSGIIGDAWAGSVNYQHINKKNLNNLGYTHGLNANISKSKQKTNYQLRQKFIQENKLNDYKYQVINIMRLKIILLSYLITLPTSFNFKAYSPFLDIDIALNMLNLPPERRKNRQWIKDFFKKNNLNIEDTYFNNINRQNTLDLQAIKKIPLKPLSKNLFVELIEEKYINWINKNIKNNKINNSISYLFKFRYFRGLLKIIKITNPKLKAYYVYLILKPIENILIKK